MKLGRKLNNRADEKISLKVKQISLQKNRAIVNHLKHKKDSVRLNALKVILKDNKIELADQISNLFLDISPKIRNFCIDNLNQLSPARIFGPLISQAIVGGLCHIIPSIKLDSLKLLVNVLMMHDFHIYIPYEIIQPILINMYDDQIKIEAKNLIIDCLSFLKPYSTHRSNIPANLINNLFSSSSLGLIPRTIQYKPKCISKVLQCHWLEASINTKSRILEVAKSTNSQLNSGIIWGAFPFFGEFADEINAKICLIFRTKETSVWVKQNWHLVTKPHLLIPAFLKLYQTSTFLKGLQELRWENYNLEERRLTLLNFVGLDLKNQCTCIPRLIFLASVHKDQESVKILTRILQWHLSKYSGIRNTVFALLKPMFEISTASLDQKGPIANLDTFTLEVFLNLYIFQK
eukprot:NODE_3_length_80033_cov_0.932970.p16 type:complete len:405 gc:universal NODE_3_length_80033_cov_0.932970:42031-43245(+)